MARKSRKWGPEWVRRVCAGCGGCMGRYRKPEGSQVPGRIVSHGLCPPCIVRLYPQYATEAAPAQPPADLQKQKGEPNE